jgi:hypothetical protein
VYRNAARALAAASTALFIASAAGAETAPAPAKPTTGKAEDPNQVICEKQQPTGSRLAVRRVCMTRAQWADLKLQDRQEIERVQVRRGMSGQ